MLCQIVGWSPSEIPKTFASKPCIKKWMKGVRTKTKVIASKTWSPFRFYTWHGSAELAGCPAQNDQRVITSNLLILPEYPFNYAFVTALRESRPTCARPECCVSVSWSRKLSEARQALYSDGRHGGLAGQQFVFDQISTRGKEARLFSFFFTTWLTPQKTT